MQSALNIISMSLTVLMMACIFITIVFCFYKYSHRATRRKYGIADEREAVAPGDYAQQLANDSLRVSARQ